MLTMISAYLAILASGLIGMEIHQDPLIATALVGHFLIFSVGTYFYTGYHNQPLTENESWNFFPVLLVFYALEYHFIDRIHPAMAPWFSLGFAGVLIGLYWLAKPWMPVGGRGSLPMLIMFTTLVCFHSVYLELLPENVRPWLFVIIMMCIACAPAGMAREGKKGFFAPVLALLAILAIEYITMIFHLLDRNSGSWLIVSFASLASLWGVLAQTDNAFLERERQGHLLLGAAHILAVMAFYRLTDGYGSLALSGAWLSYAVCVMAFAFVRKDKMMAQSALIVLAFAAGKVLLFDAASAAAIVRILCLLMTGAVLYGAGFLMRKISVWPR